MLCEIGKGLLPIAFIAGIFKNENFWLAMVLKKMFLMELLEFCRLPLGSHVSWNDNIRG
jgi:hypothetical protein